MAEHESKSIVGEVMKKIHSGQYQMKPRWYFLLGSLALFVGTTTALVSATFSFSILSFIIRAREPSQSMRLLFMLDRFPWWTIVLAIGGLVLGIWLMKKYDFSYHKNFKGIIIGLICAVLVSGWIMDGIGFNDALMRRGPGPMKRWWKEQNYQPDRRFRQFPPPPESFRQKPFINASTTGILPIKEQPPIIGR